jgi:hypothetical protein
MYVVEMATTLSQVDQTSLVTSSDLYTHSQPALTARVSVPLRLAVSVRLGKALTVRLKAALMTLLQLLMATATEPTARATGVFLLTKPLFLI